MIQEKTFISLISETEIEFCTRGLLGEVSSMSGLLTKFLGTLLFIVVTIYIFLAFLTYLLLHSRQVGREKLRRNVT